MEKYHSEPQALKQAMKCMIDHIFGNHGCCGPWCSKKQEWTIQTMERFIQTQITEEEQIPSLKILAMKVTLICLEWEEKTLPSELKEEIQTIINNNNIVVGSMFEDNSLRPIFEKVIAKFSTDEVLERLKEGGSTQGNESLHNIHINLGGTKQIFGVVQVVHMIHEQQQFCVKTLDNLFPNGFMMH